MSLTSWRVVADANVFVSAMRPSVSNGARRSGYQKPPAEELIDRWLDQQFTLLSSISIVMEIAEVLDRELKLSLEIIEEFVATLRELAEGVNVLTGGPWSSDPDDDKYLATALEGRATHLVSSDRHIHNAPGDFPFVRIRVVSFLRLLREELRKISAVEPEAT